MKATRRASSGLTLGESRTRPAVKAGSCSEVAGTTSPPKRLALVEGAQTASAITVALAIMAGLERRRVNIRRIWLALMAAESRLWWSELLRCGRGRRRRCREWRGGRRGGRPRRGRGGYRVRGSG